MKSAKPSFPALLLVCMSALLLLNTGCVGTSGRGSGGGGGGNSAPATPTGLAATAGNAQITLSWSADSGATGYYVKRSTITGGPYTQIATQSSTTYADAGLTNGTKYFYVVAAYNSAGASANSTLPPPSAPTGLSAAAGNTQITLTWTASAGATSYHVKRSTTSRAETQISAPTANSFTDTGLTNGAKYFYVVSAVNACGESANSSEVSATPTAPATPPTTPTGLQATRATLKSR